MNNNKRLLILDEDPVLINILSEQLKLYEKINIVSAINIEEALMQVKCNIFDIILLGANTLDTSGELACKQLRQIGFSSTIILMSSADINENSLQHKTCANEHITKPIRLGVLLARLRFYFREQEQGKNCEFPIGPYSFQPLKKLLKNEVVSKSIYLTDKETAILLYLYKTTERVTSREVLLDEVWGYNENVTTHTLETHVYRLRQKIEIESSKAKILVTEPGGYRLVK